MRIAIVTPRFATKDGYGGEVSAALLADQLAGRGHEVRVLAGETDGHDDCVRRVAMDADALAKNLEGMDLVHVYNMEAIGPALAAASRRKLPSVATANSYWATCLFGDMAFPDGDVCPGCHIAGIRRDYATRNPLVIGRKAPAILGRLEIWRRTRVLSKFPRIIALSQASKMQLSSAGVPAERIHVIPNMADPSWFTQKLPPLEPKPRILFVGALKRSKGAHVLLDALPEVRRDLPDATAAFVGDGPERVLLEAQARRLGLAGAVDFRGRVAPDALPALYASARVLAMPITWVEPFGRVVLEAWAHGTPFVGADLGGPHDLVQHEKDGLIVPPNDPVALAQELVRVLSDKTLATRLRTNARQRLDEFRPDRILPRIETLYQEVLESHRA